MSMSKSMVEIQKFYAKSLARELSLKEKNEMLIFLKELLTWNEIFDSEKDRKIIRHEIQTIENSRVQQAKSLQEHENDIVQCAKLFFEVYGEYFKESEKVLIIEACRRHDWGKANLIFQSIVCPKLKKYLSETERKISQIPHGFLSATTISKKEFLALYDGLTQKDFKIWLTAICYHHARKYENFIEYRYIYCERYFIKYLSQYLGQDIPKLYISNMDRTLFQNNNISLNLIESSSDWNKYVLIKGMLNKFDYIVSAGYEYAEDHADLKEKQLVKNINKIMHDRKYNLKPVQQFMSNHVEENLITIAPTGSGKTEAALLWLNGEKGFYTLPLKVSINDIYRRIKEEYTYEYVELLHSDAVQIYMEEDAGDGNQQERYDKAKLLSNPLTICTVDQLFKFVYPTLGTEIYGATLKYSKVILDEIQSYDPKILATIILGLKQIVEIGGHFSIITATFPPVLRYFLDQVGVINEKDYKFSDFSEESKVIRHKLKIKNGEMDIGEIIEKGKTQKVLVICNTVLKSQEIYDCIENLKESINVYLLHSLYIKRDRRTLERMIKEFSEDNTSTGIWITTQIVEASLDIDFDMLYTEMCTADSLLQRMGRCNRKGRYIPQEANIIIYNNENGKEIIYDSVIYDRSLKYLNKYQNIIFTEAMKRDYVNDVYCTEEIKDTEYYKKIEYWLAQLSCIRPMEYTKQQVNNIFREMGQSITVMPERIYEENREKIEKLIEMLKIDGLGKNLKWLIRNKLNELTMEINYYGHRPENINETTIGYDGKYDVTGIYLIKRTYEFDETGGGRGLVKN